MIDKFKNVDDKKIGYFISRLDLNDYNLIREIVEKHFSKLIKNNKKINNINFFNYLEKFDQSDHINLFSKKNRIFKKEYLNLLLDELILFKNLRETFKDFKITDEENIGYGNFYWRLVRPYPNKDVGTMHKDKWFWDLGTGKMDNSKYKRYKLWISIHGENKLGFKFVHGSADLNLRYDYKIADGKKKPVFDEMSLEKKQITSLKGEKGTYIIFHDELLHGGEILKNNIPRVSIECTFQTLRTS